MILVKSPTFFIEWLFVPLFPADRSASLRFQDLTCSLAKSFFVSRIRILMDSNRFFEERTKENNRLLDEKIFKEIEEINATTIAQKVATMHSILNLFQLYCLRIVSGRYLLVRSRARIIGSTPKLPSLFALLTFTLTVYDLFFQSLYASQNCRLIENSVTSSKVTLRSIWINNESCAN